MTAMTDVQVHDYVTDDGKRIAISLAVHGDPTTRRTCDMTVMVDDVERLRLKDHLGLPENIALGEWIAYGGFSCLMKHLRALALWDSSGQGRQGEPMPMFGRHIDELTDDGARWWDENLDILTHLQEQLEPAVDAILEVHPELGTRKD